MKLAQSRKGVSEIIAALLVVCITVSAATLFAVYASGLMGNILKPASQPYTEQLTLDYYNWCTTWANDNCNSIGSLTVTIRNDGAATITFADFFIQGAKTTASPLTGCPSSWPALAVQSACPLSISVPTGVTVTSGIAYLIKLVATDGTIFTFSCIAGSYT